ncbi:DNA primase [Aquiluna borgnonia]|uniref:DNA primase n=1 Tax=Aquiluna borgnonia TaxID=2499157 RepID=A0A7D4Q3Z7_9MICO|nr:DNA primase [Aquiluna borgnonia]QKJ25189.1 DNA primase [Aquiluna borgnonia]
MAGRVKQSDIEELKAKLDLVEVVSAYVSLKPASAGSFKGLCPFHSEKSPSFNVRSSPAFYHCFGCGAGGDVYKFVQEIEHVGFTEAIEKLAERSGFTLTYEDGGNQETSGRARLLLANNAAATFYQSQLQTPEGETGFKFLLSRGFDAKAIEQFGIGYAPKGWQSLLEQLKKQGFSLEELVTAGLAMPSEKGGYDRFRGRVLWPIRDANGQVLGFGARKLYEEDQGPKYLNTPETPVYHKGSVLYGLDFARKEIIKRKEIVVVEGYTDVMACHLAGFPNAVATCGTAFGEDHIKLINRLFGTSDEPASVVFTFDPDAAGQKAALRMYSDTSKFNALTFVASGPDGLDPSDLRQQRGDAAIGQMLEARKPLFEFVIRHRIAKFSLADLDSRAAAARAAAPVVAEIVDPALRAGYTRQLADWVSLDISEVSQLVSQVGRSQVVERVTPLRAEAKPVQDSPASKFERQVLEVLVQAPKAFDGDKLARIVGAGFQSSSYQLVADAANRISQNLGSPDWVNQLANQLSGEELDLLRALALAPLPASTAAEIERYAKGVVAGAMLQALAREKTDLLAALKRIDMSNQADAYAMVQRQLVELETERRTYMQ